MKKNGWQSKNNHNHTRVSSRPHTLAHVWFIIVKPEHHLNTNVSKHFKAISRIKRWEENTCTLFISTHHVDESDAFCSFMTMRLIFFKTFLCQYAHSFMPVTISIRWFLRLLLLFIWFVCLFINFFTVPLCQLSQITDESQRKQANHINALNRSKHVFVLWLDALRKCINFDYNELLRLSALR